MPWAVRACSAHCCRTSCSVSPLATKSQSTPTSRQLTVLAILSPLEEFGARGSIAKGELLGSPVDCGGTFLGCFAGRDLVCSDNVYIERLHAGGDLQDRLEDVEDFRILLLVVTLRIFSSFPEAKAQE